MYRQMLKSKIHRATVTACELHYEGSCAIDDDLLEAANLRENEQVHVWNIANGERFVTYAIRGERGSGIVSLNGSAARRAAVRHMQRAADRLVVGGVVTSPSVPPSAPPSTPAAPAGRRKRNTP